MGSQLATIHHSCTHPWPATSLRPAKSSRLHSLCLYVVRNTIPCPTQSATGRCNRSASLRASLLFPHPYPGKGPTTHINQITTLKKRPPDCMISILLIDPSIHPPVSQGRQQLLDLSDDLAHGIVVPAATGVLAATAKVPWVPPSPAAVP